MNLLKATLSKHALPIVAAIAFSGLAALAPAANAQVVVQIGIQPVCPYGYFDYEPYSCAPMGFYGTGYFYNGIFLGVGPWARWGYGHGWGAHRFAGDGGGNYHRGGNLGRSDDANPPFRPRPQYRNPNSRPGNPGGNKPNAGSPHPSGGNRPSGGGHPTGGGGGRPSGGGHPPGGNGGGSHPHDDNKP